MSYRFGIFCCLITLARCVDPLDCLKKNGRFIDDLQTGSFVVNANYNVQAHQKDTAPSDWQIPVANYQPAPSYSVHEDLSSNNAESFGHRNIGNINDINRGYESRYFQYNDVADQVKQPSLVSNKIVFPTNDIINQGNSWNDLERGAALRDSNKPSVRELEQVIKKLIQGSTKVHQVVKVPAMYEIHLHGDRDASQVQETAQASQSHAWELTDSQNSWRNVEERGDHRLVTKLWPNGFQPSPTGINEIPSPTLVTETFKRISSPSNKHSWPLKNSRSNKTNTISSFSVPISPGSTTVTLTNYPPASNNYVRKTQLAKTRDVLPNLSLYYAKKRQMEKEKAQYKTSFRRTNVGNTNLKKQNQKLYKKHDTGRYVGPPLLNYLIYVKEKPENRRIIFV